MPNAANTTISLFDHVTFVAQAAHLLRSRITVLWYRLDAAKHPLSPDIHDAEQLAFEVAALLEYLREQVEPAPPRIPRTPVHLPPE